MGYDGKGQKIVRSAAELENENMDGMILEEFVSFDRELSMIALEIDQGR